jgi:hypothetical protein
VTAAVASRTVFRSEQLAESKRAIELNFLHRLHYTRKNAQVATNLQQTCSQGRTQPGGQGATAPLEKTIFTIFRMSLIILWIFGTFFGI